MDATLKDIGTLGKLLSNIFKSNEVIVLHLFGSVAEGIDRRDADIDIAVLLSKDTDADE